MDTTSVWRATAPRTGYARSGRCQCRRADHRRRHHRCHPRNAAGPAGALGGLARSRRHRQRQHRQLDRQPLRNPEPGPAHHRQPLGPGRCAPGRGAASRRDRIHRRACGSAPTADSAAATSICTPISQEQRAAISQEFTALSQAGCSVRLDASVPAPLPQPVGDAWCCRGRRSSSRRPMWRTSPALAAQAGAQLYEHSRVIELDAKARRAATATGAVKAQEIVLATHTPKGFHLVQAEMPVHREYGIARPLTGADPGPGIFWWRGDERYSGAHDAVAGPEFPGVRGPGTQGRHPQRQGQPDGDGERDRAAIRRCPGKPSLVGAELSLGRRPALHRPRFLRVLHRHGLLDRRPGMGNRVGANHCRAVDGPITRIRRTVQTGTLLAGQGRQERCWRKWGR